LDKDGLTVVQGKTGSRVYKQAGLITLGLGNDIETTSEG
jgi:hypothetical protein